MKTFELIKRLAAIEYLKRKFYRYDVVLELNGGTMTIPIGIDYIYDAAKAIMDGRDDIDDFTMDVAESIVDAIVDLHTQWINRTPIYTYDNGQEINDADLELIKD